MNRRQFVYVMSAAALAAAGTVSAKEKSRRPLRNLVLGGTKFLGVHIVELALQRGHTVTLFNRGKTNADLFPQLEHLKGDRDAQLDALKGRRWDAVIDDSGYVPRHVKLSAELLAPNVQRYVFVSTISVYASFAKPNTEDSPVGKLADETTEKVDGGAYGPLKALCEKAAEAAMPGRVAVVRPGLIVGPRDPTDRFTYWPARCGSQPISWKNSKCSRGRTCRFGYQNRAGMPALPPPASRAPCMRASPSGRFSRP